MPEFKYMPETHVAFVTRVGRYDRSINQGFKALFDWLASNHVQPVGPSLGVFYDDPAHVAEESLRCDLCAPVGPEVEGAGEVRTKEIGGWQVATITYEGEENSKSAYSEIYDWLREQGYHESDAPIEKYLSQLGEPLKVELAVPVVEKKLLPGEQKTKTKEKKSTPAKETGRTTKTTKSKSKSAKPSHKSR